MNMDEMTDTEIRAIVDSWLETPEGIRWQYAMQNDAYLDGYEAGREDTYQENGYDGQ